MNTQTAEQALQKMPQQFTSNAFYKIMRKINPDGYISDHLVLIFLKTNCIHLDKRLWEKKALQSKQMTIDTSLEQAIALVKAAGLRIMKPVNEWQEI